MFLNILQMSQESTCVGVSLTKQQVFRAATYYKKETPTKVFSWEICDIFRNTYLYKTPSMAASVDDMPYLDIQRILF